MPQLESDREEGPSPMRLKMLQIAGLAPDLRDQLEQRVELINLNRLDDVEQFFNESGEQVELLVTHGGKGCSVEMMQRLPRLRVILSWGVGYDKIDLAEAKRRGIQVANTPDVLNACVADMAIGMILNQSRRLIELSNWMRAGEWERVKSPPLGRRVTGTKLGILGLGRIGLEVARRAEAFSMQIRYHNRNPRPDLPYVYEPSLLKLARWSDFLVVLCPGGDQTRNLVDATLMRALGPESVLVNLARGSVVDESALIELLHTGELGGAALDVFQTEPNFPRTLLELPQVVLFPHIASATEQTRSDMSQLLIDNLDQFLRAGTLQTPVQH